LFPLPPGLGWFPLLPGLGLSPELLPPELLPGSPELSGEVKTQ